MLNKNKDKLPILEEPDPISDPDFAKISRCNNAYFSDLPRCYFENTSKEELVLEHVLEYKR